MSAQDKIRIHTRARARRKSTGRSDCTLWRPESQFVSGLPGLSRTHHHPSNTMNVCCDSAVATAFMEIRAF